VAAQTIVDEGDDAKNKSKAAALKKAEITESGVKRRAGSVEEETMA